MNRKLQECRNAANLVLRCADLLGGRGAKNKDLTEAAKRFRDDCEQWVEHRGVKSATIAFVGPTKAGKTTLLRLLIRNGEVAGRLKAGVSTGTEKITWIGPDVPPLPDPAREEIHLCKTPDLYAISGIPYGLIDVPGEDDRTPFRRAAALKALNWARIKVLVVSEQEIRDGGYRTYLSHCQGATVLPVVNRVHPAGLDAESLAEFEGAIRSSVGQGKVLPVQEVRDFNRRETSANRQEWEEKTRGQLIAALGSTIHDVDPGRELDGKLRGFRAVLRQYLETHLSQTASALREVESAERELPQKLVASFLQPMDIFRAGLARKMRQRYLALTPRWTFPWRPILALSNLIDGAIDRVPFATMGSIPSAVHLVLAAWKNHSSDVDFDRKLLDRCTARLEAVAELEMRPLVNALQSALDRDLPPKKAGTRRMPVTLESRVLGVEPAVAHLKEIVDEQVAVNAPAVRVAVANAAVGVGIFCLGFAWPLLALYSSYVAAWPTFELSFYPTGVWSSLLTSFALSVLPMCLWMIASNGVLFSSRRVGRVFSEIEHRVDAAESRLRDHLVVRVESPEIDALKTLGDFAHGTSAVLVPESSPPEPLNDSGDGGANGSPDTVPAAPVADERN